MCYDHNNIALVDEGMYGDFSNQSENELKESENLEQLSPEEKLTWEEVQPQLNYWGKQFSLSTKADKLQAIDKIYCLMDKVIKKYDPSDIRKKSEYEGAIAMLVANYGRVDALPIKYVGVIYPDEQFYLALNETLGFGVSETGNCLGRVYDHTKGASFTTHFLSVLRYTIYDSFVKHKKSSEVVSLSLFEDKEDDAPRTTCDDVSAELEVVNRNKMRLMFDFAKLTEAVTLACKNKEAGDKEAKKDPLSKINHTHLTLFYTLHLINFTRYSDALPKDSFEESVIMSAADQGFELFSTTVNKNDTGIYQMLAKASLSEKVLSESGFTKKFDGYLVVSDKAAACYSNTPTSTLCDRFNTLREKLFPYLN